jgi:hypothetical protein
MGRQHVPRKFDPNTTELSGDLHRAEIVEALREIRFIWDGELHTIAVDKDVRDFLIDALQTKR